MTVESSFSFGPLTQMSRRSYLKAPHPTQYGLIQSANLDEEKQRKGLKKQREDTYPKIWLALLYKSAAAATL